MCLEGTCWNWGNPSFQLVLVDSIAGWLIGWSLNSTAWDSEKPIHFLKKIQDGTQDRAVNDIVNWPWHHDLVSWINGPPISSRLHIPVFHTPKISSSHAPSNPHWLRFPQFTSLWKALGNINSMPLSLMTFMILRGPLINSHNQLPGDVERFLCVENSLSFRRRLRWMCDFFWGYHRDMYRCIFF